LRIPEPPNLRMFDGRRFEVLMILKVSTTGTFRCEGSSNHESLMNIANLKGLGRDPGDHPWVGR
jgi:hypothetical protein